MTKAELDAQPLIAALTLWAKRNSGHTPVASVVGNAYAQRFNMGRSYAKSITVALLASSTVSVRQADQYLTLISVPLCVIYPEACREAR